MGHFKVSSYMGLQCCKDSEALPSLNFRLRVYHMHAWLHSLHGKNRQVDIHGCMQFYRLT